MTQPLDPVQVRVAWGMLLILFLIFAVDGYLWWYHGEDATFSRTARAIAQRWPAFPIAVSLGAGLLLGHCFL